MMEQNNSSLREILLECTTQQLDAMLHTELHKDLVDEKTVRMIMSVLEEREADHPVDVNDDLAAAWERYQAERDGMRGQSPPKHIIRLNWAVKAASILLVLSIAVSLFSQEVRAEAFLDKMARWTESIFELFSPGYQNDNEIKYVFKTDHPGLQQVYNLVSELGVTTPVVPMYLPEELELIDLKQDSTSKVVGVIAVFSGKEGDAVLRFDIFSDDISGEYHKNQTDVRLFEKAGITHYLLQNYERCTAVWVNQNIECILSINCQEGVLLRILKSIYIAEEE